MRRTVLAMFFIAWLQVLSSFPTYAEVEKQPVDRVLVLAMDVSDSINDARYTLQIKGYAEAFRDPETIRTITSGQRKAVAVTMAHWGGWGEHQQTVTWTVIRSLEDGQRFADLIEQSRRVRMQATSIAWALLSSAKLIDEAPYTAPRSIIDISGDGYDNTWTYPNLNLLSELSRQGIKALRKRPLDKADVTRLTSLAEAHQKVCDAGIEINGLAIEGAEEVVDLTSYYLNNVICGIGSFVIRVENPDSYDDFLKAIIRKIRQELSS